jgi:hypothetical protein
MSTQPVYSIAMFEQHDLVGLSASVGPEDGFLWVVRCVDFVIGNALAQFAFVGAGGQAVFSESVGPQAGFSTSSWRGRYVVTHPEQIYFSSTSAVDVTASGYNLSLP